MFHPSKGSVGKGFLKFISIGQVPSQTPCPFSCYVIAVLHCMKRPFVLIVLSVWFVVPILVRCLLFIRLVDGVTRNSRNNDRRINSNGNRYVESSLFSSALTIKFSYFIYKHTNTQFTFVNGKFRGRPSIQLQFFLFVVFFSSFFMILEFPLTILTP